MRETSRRETGREKRFVVIDGPCGRIIAASAPTAKRF